jgi:type IV secretory pathway TraG/TraD family ATPase VirD4
VPLQSPWLDLLILRLITATPQKRETLFILDELAVLDTLSQLHTEVTENREFGNPMVIGAQDPAQVRSATVPSRAPSCRSLPPASASSSAM